MSSDKKIVPKGKIIECGSCGADFDEMLPACPYCGSMSIKGAEAQYMNKLEDVRADMEDLGNVVIDETKKEVKKQGKFILKVIGIILAVLLLLVGVELIFGHDWKKRDPQEDYLWQQENFPKLDELYKQESYEELLVFYNEAYEEDRPIYDWEHAEFCSALDILLGFEEILEKEMSGGELTKYDYIDLLYAGFRVDNYEESSAYSVEEKEKLAPYIAVVREDFATRWNFTQKQLEDFERERTENHGYISYEMVRDYVDDWMERSGK